jgi:electron transport complex protein RnfB
MIPVTGDKTGWEAWNQLQADAARVRHDQHAARLARERDAAEARKAARVAGSAKPVEPVITGATAAETDVVPPEDEAQAKKRAIIQAAMERARKKKEELAKLGAGPKNIDSVSPEVQAQIDAAEARRRRLGLTDPANAPDNDPDA